MQATLDRWRLTLSHVALWPTAFGLLHHAEHVVRGDVNWPLSPELGPFTFSLLIYPLIALDFYLLLVRRVVAAGYTLALSVGGFLLVAGTHLVPGAADSVGGGAQHYLHEGNPAGAVVALMIVVGLLGSIVWLGVAALQARRATGRW